MTKLADKIEALNGAQRMVLYRAIAFLDLAAGEGIGDADEIISDAWEAFGLSEPEDTYTKSAGEALQIPGFIRAREASR